MDQITSEVGMPDRRALILDAATVLFCKNGYSGTRMSDVADAINVTKPIIYRYFKSKEELFSVWVDAVLVKRREAIINRILSSKLSVKEETSEILKRTFDGLSSGVSLAPWRIALMESDNFPQITKLVSEKFKYPILNAIEQLMARGLESGELKGESASTLAYLFCAPIAAGASIMATFGADHEAVKHLDYLFNVHHKAFFKAFSA